MRRAQGQAAPEDPSSRAATRAGDVKAGTFDAFLIDWSSAAVNGAPVSSYSESGSFWYAPELGWIVKTQHDPSSGGGYARLSDDEVVRIER